MENEKPIYFQSGYYECFKGKVEKGKKQGKGLVKIRNPAYEYLEEFQDDIKVRENPSKYLKNIIPYKLCEHKSSKVSCLNIYKNWIVSGSFNELVIQDKTTKEVLFRTNTEMIDTVSFFHHKNYMISTHNTAKYRIWDLEKFVEIRSEKIFRERDIWSCVITEDDKYIIFSNNFDDCYCINASNYEIISKSQQHYLSYYQGTLIGAYCEYISIVEIPTLNKIKKFAASHGVYTIINNKNENIIAGVFQNGIQIFNFDGSKIKQIPSSTIHFWSMSVYKDWILYAPCWGQIDTDIIQMIHMNDERRIEIKNNSRVWKVIFHDDKIISGDENGNVLYYEWNENFHFHFQQERLNQYNNIHFYFK